MKNYVIYRGGLIAKNSDAYQLWLEHRWKELDAHIARLAQAEKALRDRY